MLPPVALLHVARGSGFYCSKSMVFRHPDLKLVDHKFRGTMHDLVYWAKARDVDDLKQRLIDLWDSLEQSVIDDDTIEEINVDSKAEYTA